MVSKWYHTRTGLCDHSVDVFMSLVHNILSDAKRGSMFHILDKFSAVQYVVCMMFVTAKPESGRQFCLGMKMFLPIAMIVPFLIGDMFFKRSLYDFQLAFHLLFRYVGYWWGHLLLVPEETYFPRAFISLSLGYFGHIAGVNELARRKNLFQTEDLYWGSCATLILWVLVCGQVHLLVSYGPESTTKTMSMVQEIIVWLAYSSGLLASIISLHLTPTEVIPSRALHMYQEELRTDKKKIDFLEQTGLISSDNAFLLKSDLDMRLNRRKEVFLREHVSLCHEEDRMKSWGNEVVGSGVTSDGKTEELKGE